jgi:hypothetical protein
MVMAPAGPQYLAGWGLSSEQPESHGQHTVSRTGHRAAL